MATAAATLSHPTQACGPDPPAAWFYVVYKLRMDFKDECFFATDLIAVALSLNT